jgi:flagellar basal-body rod modification protein FlgD
MSIDSINNYTSYSTGSTSSSSDNSKLSMDDFLQLLVAQLKNQDMYNTMDNAEYMGQMAQFSMLQALTDMSELSMTSYGVSLIGKEATIAQIGDDGTVTSLSGIVESVNFYNGSTQVVVDGKNYALSSVMSVKEPDIIIPDSMITEESDQETVEADDSDTETTATDDSVAETTVTDGSDTETTATDGSNTETTETETSSDTETGESGGADSEIGE